MRLLDRRATVLPLVGLTGLCALSACGGSSGETVDLSLSPRVEGHAIVVEGETDLPDGAMILYEVEHGAYATTEDTMDLFVPGLVPVSDGRYSVTVPAETWPAGRVTVWVAFQAHRAGDQPPGVEDRYGLKGKHLTGSNVSEVGALRRVAIERAVTLP